MTLKTYLRDKLPYLLAMAFAVVFTAVLLSVLRVHPSAVAFLCLVFSLCGLIPLAAEGAVKLDYYREAAARLDALGEKYLFSELMDEAGFAEGEFFCEAMAAVNKSMNDHVSAARRDMSEYREYVETWVHEIKTPIASARLTLENHPWEQTAALEEELFEIDGYVEQALFYARSGAVERDYLVKAMPLREAAANAVKKYARSLVGAGFQLELDGLDAIAYSDPKWVEFILGQLVSNAVKNRGPQPRLTFSQRVEAASVTLIVADNGPGIRPEDLPRVFDKGFTGQNGRMLATKSTGLGLYLCKKLCDRLGLGLVLRSVEGRGTAAELTFPKSRFHLAE